MLERRLGSLRQLQVLRAVADEGGIGRAAEALHLSQPAVSLQLQKLAAAIETPIYHLIGRELRFTEAGQRLVDSARLILAEVSSLEADLNALKGLEAGTLRLAVVNTAEYFFPELIARFCERHPGIDVRLAIGNRDQILLRLQQRRDDLYVFSAVPDEKDLVAKPFLDNPLVAIAPVDHPWRARRRVPLKDLARQPLIVREPGSGTRLALQQLFESNGLALTPKVEMASNEAIKDAVLAGLGIGLVSAHTLRRDASGIAVLSVTKLPLMSRWSVVHPRSFRPSALTTAFLRELEQTAGAVAIDRGAHKSRERQ